MKKILVLLAAYNCEDWIDEQINSILLQIKVDVDILISVDKSNDNTEAICRRYADKNKNITLLETDLSFGGAASNFFHLISEADLKKYDYVSFSDHDDIWNLDKLFNASTLLEKSNYSAYSSNVIAYWKQTGKKVLINKAQPQKIWDYLFESAGPGCTFLLDVNLMSAIKNYLVNNKNVVPSIWLHDWFVYAYARSFDYKWYIDSSPTMLYRQHINNQVGANMGFKAFFHRVNFVLSGKALEQTILLSNINPKSNADFVTSWNRRGRLGMLKLALSANQCRRRLRDKFLFFLSCLLIFLVGTK